MNNVLLKNSNPDRELLGGCGVVVVAAGGHDSVAVTADRALCVWGCHGGSTGLLGLCERQTQTDNNKRGGTGVTGRVWRVKGAHGCLWQWPGQSRAPSGRAVSLNTFQQILYHKKSRIVKKTRRRSGKRDAGVGKRYTFY